MSHLQSSQLFSVDGLVAIVTGGGSGLGRAMALTLAENGASKVFILGRREESLQETAALSKKDSIIPVRADISSKESLQAAYDTVAAQTDHVNLLIANSGVAGDPTMRPLGPKPDGSSPSLSEIRDHLWSFSMQEVSGVMDVNVTGTYFTVLAFLPLLDAANKKRPAPVENQPAAPTAQVIITSSIAAFNRRVAFNVAYNLSKAAVNHLIKILSTTLTPYHIRVNGIAPGLYLSEMTTSSFGFKDSGVTDGSFPKEVVPLTRSGSEQEFAGMVLWMASASGAYINGNITVTDGGRLSTVPCTY
ncbi:short chain dehydrogenase/reductase family [Aspergillus sclerotiicarbonarius CBS 121057]|uniref:Short chain dehydrogenase/reductase family n=1 Tax=Aspergillus sclerotiicarbonarius (strain CBS 121057 / IBT 28362) TaxID=1448318 RepID=A0A319EFB2_ASPSB|nr:short chain dehydrogenase/reductase family [Aspergillus sclerotiicarbonarius CBS 121057]